MAQTPMTIIIVTPLGKGGCGGIDRLNDTIVEALSAEPDLDVRAIAIATRGSGSLLAAPFVFAWAVARFVWLGLRGRPDVVHIHLSIRGSAVRKCLMAGLARAFRIPYVTHLHGIEVNEFWRDAGPLLAPALEQLFDRSARIVVMGDYWARVISDRLPQTASRIVVLPNSAPKPAADPPALDEGATVRDERVHITFLGRLGARKGTPVLVAALGRLGENRKWRATIAGDGEVEEVRRSVAALGLSARIQTPGWLEIGARNRVLASSDVLVLPSTAENLPMVIMEAMAFGVAVVATPIGAVPEVIDNGRNGLLTPVGDIDALALALTRLIEDKPLRVQLAAAAKSDYDEKYDFRVYMRRLVATWVAAGGVQEPDGAVQPAG